MRDPAAGAASAPQQQRFGPLQVRRMRKDDGRSLTVYSRAEQER